MSTKEIICSNLKCKHWKQSGICNFKTIILKYSNIATINQGRKDILECSRFEESKEYKEMKQQIKKLKEE